MNHGIYGTRKCYNCGNEIKGKCRYCFSTQQQKRKTAWKKKNRAAFVEAKHDYKKIMEAQEYWLKNL